MSSQIEAVGLPLAEGAGEASALADAAGAGALAATAQVILARAAGLGAREAQQLELSLLEGSVFVVRSGGRTILATTRPDPTVGLVLYDLRSCLRNLAEEPQQKPKARRSRSRAQSRGNDGA